MLQLEARAKINWTLDILGPREDGYHLMDMLMQSVLLADVLALEEARDITLLPKSGGYTTAASGKEAAAEPVPFDENNLAYKAALLLKQYTGCNKGVTITLQKRIPSGAGMGGGSADAAAVLWGLNRLWRLNLSSQQLLKLGLRLGADVPFMLTGGLARVGGIGERIQPLTPAPEVWLLLVQPCDGLSTRDIFTAYDSPAPDATILRPNTQLAQNALLTGKLPALGMAMNNVLEGISISKRPAIRQTIQRLEAAGAIRAMMTGSGSVVYGVFANEQAALAASRQLKEDGVFSMVTRTADAGIAMLEA